MHQENIWPLVPNMYNVFEESRDIMVPNFIDLLKKTRLNSGDNNIRTMKLIHSDVSRIEDAIWIDFFR